MSILINRFNLRMALHQQNLSPDIADMLTNKIAELLERDKALKTDHFHCPKCGRYFVEDFAFCPDCGQRLDWSEE